MRLRGIFRQPQADSRRLVPAGSGKPMFLLLFCLVPGEVLHRRQKVYSADAIRTPGTPHMAEMARPGQAPTAPVLHLPSFCRKASRLTAWTSKATNATTIDKRRPPSTYEAAWLPAGLRFIDTLRVGVGEMSGRRSEVDPTISDAARRLRRATFRKFAASKFVIRVAWRRRAARYVMSRRHRTGYGKAQSLGTCRRFQGLARRSIFRRPVPDVKARPVLPGRRLVVLQKLSP